MQLPNCQEKTRQKGRSLRAVPMRARGPPASGTMKLAAAQIMAVAARKARSKSRLLVASRIRPASQGPMNAPMYPVERIIPLAVAADSLGNISDGRASIMGNVPPVAMPTTAINGQPRGTGIKKAAQEATTRRSADPDMNGLLKPNLYDAQGIRNMAGIVDQPADDDMKAARRGEAPLMVNRVGVHADQV